MNIRVECPHGHRMKVPAHRADTEIRCAHCGALTLVPSLAPPPLSQLPEGTAIGDEEYGPAMVSIWGTEPEIHADPMEAEPAATVAMPLNVSLSELLSEGASAPAASGSASRAGRVRGYEASPERVAVAGNLAVGLVIVAVLGLLPCAQALIRFVTVQDSGSLPRWVFAVALISLLEIAYAIYFGQLPDWSSAWVVSLVALTATAAYAVVLSVSILGNADSELAVGLEIGDLVRNNSASRWCLLMMLSTSTLTFICGWLGLRWHRAFQTVIVAENAKANPG